MIDTESFKIDVDVVTEYLVAQSLPDKNRYAHAYHVTITNNGTHTSQLLGRHWFIIDGNEEIQEVKGEGVVGQQPILEPGDSYQYTSGTIIPTEVGCMHGNYLMLGEDGTHFEALIPPFTLAIPGTLN